MCKDKVTTGELMADIYLVEDVEVDTGGDSVQMTVLDGLQVSEMQYGDIITRVDSSTVVKTYSCTIVREEPKTIAGLIAYSGQVDVFGNMPRVLEKVFSDILDQSVGGNSFAVTVEGLLMSLVMVKEGEMVYMDLPGYFTTSVGKEVLEKLEKLVGKESGVNISTILEGELVRFITV